MKIGHLTVVPENFDAEDDNDAEADSDDNQERPRLSRR